VTGRWFSPGTPVSSTDKTDRHYITEILLKVTLNTIKKTVNPQEYISGYTKVLAMMKRFRTLKTIDFHFKGTRLYINI
jgi:hypothetical protein